PAGRRRRRRVARRNSAGALASLLQRRRRGTMNPTPEDVTPRAREPEPGRRDIKRWQRYLSDERAEAAVYRDLAGRRSGEEREILLELADAEGRHAAHWQQLLGERAA